MKKFITFLLITLTLGVFTLMPATPTHAACRHLLGMKSWDCETNSFSGNKTPSETELKNDIWIIAGNVATDIAVIAAYLIIGYVIYGGYLYIFSEGDPGKTAIAKKTLSRAFIGLAIVLSANLIMESIRIALVGKSGNIGNCAKGENECVTAEQMVTNLINWFIGIAGVVSLIFLVYGGILYITSAGDAGKVQKAKNMIMYSIIGLIIVALATTITAFVSSSIRQAGESAYIINLLTKGGA